MSRSTHKLSNVVGSVLADSQGLVPLFMGIKLKLSSECPSSQGAKVKEEKGSSRGHGAQGLQKRKRTRLVGSSAFLARTREEVVGWGEGGVWTGVRAGRGLG